MRVKPVILSGGAGTRLWPMSRPERPKQFLALTGDQTMFQMTVQRCADPSKFSPPVVVANAAHAELIDAQLTEIGVDEAQLLLEPCARNTAPAIALAALAVDDPKTPLLVMPSDHVIADPAAFSAAIDAALPMVTQGWLATFGITPTGPETGYGYIKSGERLADGVQRVERFVEKPDATRAAEMIASGDHLWNGGIFLFRADIFLGALAAHAPDMLAAAQAAMDKAERSGNRILPDKESFEASPADSIDYAVMENAAREDTGRVAVVPVSMGWSDVGSWDALYDLGASTPAEGNIEIEGKGNLIRSNHIRIHSVGMEDMIVVADGDDVLIVPRGKSQDVKKIIEALKERD